MTRKKSAVGKFLLLYVLAPLALLSTAQNSAAFGIRVVPPDKGYNNSWGASLSYGQGITKDSWLWGWSADYSRVLTEDGDWILTSSLAWDRDTEKKPGEDAVAENYSVTVSVGYLFWRNLFIGTGVGKGLWEREVEPERKDWKRVKSNKDWSTGIFLSGDIWSSGRYDISPSFSLEYNISNNRWSWSADLGWSMAF